MSADATGGEHGNYAAYQRHRKAGEEPCAPCREAAAEYQRQRRAKGGEPIARDLAQQRARSAALYRLKELHRSEYELLVADEMRVEARRAREAVSA